MATKTLSGEISQKWNEQFLMIVHITQAEDLTLG